jgi:hypothetical protein
LPASWSKSRPSWLLEFTMSGYRFDSCLRNNSKG